jgi:hypothetical protein
MPGKKPTFIETSILATKAAHKLPYISLVDREEQHRIFAAFGAEIYEHFCSQIPPFATENNASTECNKLSPKKRTSTRKAS